MKDGAKEILGKTIRSVIIKRGKGEPRSQLMLVFEDNTWFEFYCPRDIILPAGGIDAGSADDARRYMSPPMEICFEAAPRFSAQLEE